MRRSRTWLAVLALLGLNLAIVALGELFRQTVVPGWKKGPLIDPAAPYSPENAQLLFSFSMCLALDLYVGVLALWRRFRPARAWVPWLALALSLVATEGAIRAWLAVDMVTYFRPHPILHWVVRSDLRDFTNLTGGGTISTNHDGMRMPGPDQVREAGPVDPNVFRIVVLGDSSNFGHGVEGDEMWSAVLEKILDPLTPRKVEVINAACPGWTTYQAVQDLDLRVLAYPPDLVIAGFNNDPGPDYFHDADRVLPPGLRRDLAATAWKSELFLITREVVLSLIRRVSPAARATYTQRHAGEDPKYGRLSPEEEAALVPRVPLDEFLSNVRTLDERGAQEGYRFVWVDMPVNRNQPELVARYVDWGYRKAVHELAQQLDFPVVEVDGRWVRQRARDLHLDGHVFHPNVEGHRRLAEQAAEVLLARDLVPQAQGSVTVEGPPPAPTADTLRFGWSSRTPVHAHVGAVLAAMPELAARYGITLVDTSYASGKEQGEDVASGALDAFFSCEVPAIQMLAGRRDTRIVGSPGALGRIAVVARTERAHSLAELHGARVGLAEGSTPAMDWQDWGRDLDATVVPLGTDELEPALARGEVDAIVGWDPWVEQWLEDDPGRGIVASREFRSVLAVSVPWSLPLPVPAGDPPAARLLALVDEALRIAASDRPRWDAEVARRSGWPLAVVRAVADENELLSGRATTLELGPTDLQDLDRAARWSHHPDLGATALVALELLKGETPPGFGIGPVGGPVGGPGPDGHPMGPPPPGMGPQGPPRKAEPPANRPRPGQSPR